MMIVTLLVMFLIRHSSGNQDILTVPKISVEKHHNITIPCLYDQKYVSNKKYVSFGGVFLFSAEVTHNRMSIVDNQTERVFTATLRNAKVSDTGTYWCGISAFGNDPGKKLYLEVIKGKARLHVSSQNVSGYEGGNVAVVCHGALQWCQIGGSCVGRNGETSDKSVVHISGDGDTLNVSFHELKKEDSGWYYCSDGKSQMPVHISVRKASQVTRQVTVQYTGHTTAFSQDRSKGLKSVHWLVILGVMLPIIICAAAILIRVYNKRKQKAETSNPCEGMNNQQLTKGNEENDKDSCENLYQKTGIKQNNQRNGKNEEVACEILYEMTGFKHNIQGNEKNKVVPCGNLYEITTGIKQNIQGNEKKSEVENLYETMTGIKQNIQLNTMDDKDIYESMVRKVK